MTSLHLSPEAQERLRRRAETYRSTLGEKRRALQALLERFNASPTADHRARLQHDVHRLRGSAKIYGCDQLHDRAAACEEVLVEEPDEDLVRGAVERVLQEMDKLAAS